jgi:ribosomal peptide maturation radical SAM protein 1
MKASLELSLPRRVLLVLPPWASPYFPGLSVALLRSLLIQEQIPCDIFYANLLFSKTIDGNPLYEEQLSKDSYAELAFTPFYFDVSTAQAADTLRAHFDGPAMKPLGLEPWTKLYEQVEEFMNLCMASVNWDDYDIVGFSLMFQQTLSSLAIARRIREAHPSIKIIFGGPGCAAPMGQELLRSFAEIDYVVMGEADTTIAPLVREIRKHSGGVIETPGVVYRTSAGQIAESGSAKPFFKLDNLPIPDYGPYFEQVEKLKLTHFDSYLYIENSRGCWWGEKHHCTFCGIDDDFMVYRSKSTERILEEILTLSRAHRRTSFLTADNILDHRYYKTLLPRLKQLREEEGYDFTFFFELKSNLTREHARLLHGAGVSQVQPGIESFSDNLLQLMDKGSTGIQQLQALKYLAEFNIQPIWNIIYMNPNERAEDYSSMIEMVPFMHHLPPLEETGQVQMLLQRFNMYFEYPEQHGITNIRPQAFYKDLFPREDIDLERLAFFFDYDREKLMADDLQAVHAGLLRAMAEWRECYVRDSLLQTRGPGFVEITDRRKWPVNGKENKHGNGNGNGNGSKAPRTIMLDGLAAAVFLECDRVRGESELLKAFAGQAESDEVLRILGELVAQRLVYRSPRRRYLNLPLLKDRNERFMVSAFEES